MVFQIIGLEYRYATLTLVGIIYIFFFFSNCVIPNNNLFQEVAGMKTPHDITLDEAKQFIANQRSRTQGNVAVGSHFGQMIGGMFSKEALQNLLNQSGCTGMRFYFGANNSGQPVLVLVGVDGSGNDMTGGVMLERCQPLMANQAKGDLGQ